MSNDRTPASTYLHGTTPPEQERLARLNELLNARHLAEVAPRSGERVIDFGAGLGQLARALARAVGPAGRVVGIERSAAQLVEARRLGADHAEQRAAPVELRLGEVEAPPLAPDEWGTFDLAHGRYILEHVRDPLLVVRQMVRSVRPGGRVVLADDDHEPLRLWPEPPGFAALWRAYMRTYDRIGNDPLVGRRLVSLLHAAGATPVRNTMLFFGGCSGDGVLDLLVQNMVGLFEGARAAILACGEVDDEHYGRALDELMRWRTRPDAALWFHLAFAEGRVG